MDNCVHPLTYNIFLLFSESVLSFFSPFSFHSLHDIEIKTHCNVYMY